MKSCIVLLVCMLSFGAFAQQKNVNSNEMTSQLSTIQAEITLLDEKIQHINTRIAGIPPQDIDPSVNEKLSKLETRKTDLERIQLSLENYLNGNSSVPVDVKIITMEQFNQYPQENQQQILAHPERYVVVGM